MHICAMFGHSVYTPPFGKAISSSQSNHTLVVALKLCGFPVDCINMDLAGGDDRGQNGLLCKRGAF